MPSGPFQPGHDPRRNVKQIFKPGDGRFQKGVSGNPQGLPGDQVEYRLKLPEVAEGQMSREDLVALVVKAARKGQTWAILKLCTWYETQDRPMGDDGQVIVTVNYVEKNRTLIIETAPIAADGDSGVGAVQRPVVWQAMGQDDAGAGPADTASTAGQTSGVVRAELPPAQ